MRVIEAVELVACRVFNLAHQTRQRITFGDVERHLAQLASHPPECACGRAQGDGVAGLRDRQRLAASGALYQEWWS